MNTSKHPNKITKVMVFTKEPKPNFVKTRLTPPLTACQSAEFAESLLIETVDKVSRVRGKIKKILCYFLLSGRNYFKKFSKSWEIQEQEGNNLGERLSNAIEDNFKNNSSPLIVIGSDSPTLPPFFLEMGVSALAKKKVTIGPAVDGGFYLIGFDRFYPGILKNIRWSSRYAYSDVIANLKKLQIVPYILPRWYDIDNIADFNLLANHLNFIPLSKFKKLRKVMDKINKENSYFNSRRFMCRDLKT